MTDILDSTFFINIKKLPPSSRLAALEAAFRASPKLIIPDVVFKEVTGDLRYPGDVMIVEWMLRHNIRQKITTIGAQLENGQISSFNAGEKAIMEILSELSSNSRSGRIISDDNAFFNKFSDPANPNYDPSLKRVGTAGAFESWRAAGAIHDIEYVGFRDLIVGSDKIFVSDPSAFKTNAELGFPDLTASQLAAIEGVRSFATAMGIAGFALAGVDAWLSTTRATEQYLAGDKWGAFDTEAEMFGRIAGGFYGSAVGYELTFVVVATLFPPSAALEAALLAGALAGAIGGSLAGHKAVDAALLLGTDFGKFVSALIGLALDHITPSGLPTSPPTTADPLVLDLAGAGIKLESLTGSHAHFDFDANGFAPHTGWIAPGMGLLVLDDGLNDGTVTANELVGARSGYGFGDLRALDANGDGVIDSRDAAYARLRVWTDPNGDRGLRAPCVM